jgi:signal transduction histidine kinase/DNA-binding response OmpR family regulator
MLSHFWNQFLTNNGHYKVGDKDYQRACVNNLVLFVMIIFFVVFAFSNLTIYDNEKVAYVDLLGLGLILMNLFIFKSTQNVSFSTHVTTITLLSSLLAYIFVVGDKDYSYIWAALFPIAAYLLMNQIGALFYTLVLVVSIVLIQYYHIEIEKETVFDPDVFIDLIAASVSLFFLVLFVDFQRQKAQIELDNAVNDAREAKDAKYKFLSKINHEIRSPLNGIIGFTDLLTTTDPSQVQKEYLQNINLSGKALLGIVNDILDFSQLDAGKLELNKIQTNIVELIEDVITVMKFQADLKKIELKLIYPEQLPEIIEADPVRLKQVLMSLMSNAVKFTDKGSVTLKVAFSPKTNSSGRFTFSVIDTGIGIREEFKSRLFEAFSQDNEMQADKLGGVGLGLAVSSMIVNKMGGELELKSQLGKGSEFQFVIETRYEYWSKEKIDEHLPVKHVLLVDADANTHKILSYHFQKWGLKFTACIDEEGALQALKNQPSIDVMLCDFEVNNGTSGLTLIKKIREELAFDEKRLPIIFTHTQHEDEILRKQCKELGIKFVLSKPLKATQLFYYFKNLNEIAMGGVYVKDRNKAITSVIQKPCTIMIAEDVAISMMLVKTMLKKMTPNAHIIEATNGQEALDIILNYEVDVVLMDVQMPEVDGLKATKTIRQREQSTEKHTPIIALTAGATEEEKSLCFESGMDEYLAKPIKSADLFEILRKYLN